MKTFLRFHTSRPLTLLVLLLLASQAAPQARAQLVCDNDVYISQSLDDGSTFVLSRLDQSTLPYTLTPLGPGATDDYNAIGFNYLDGFVYGIKPMAPNNIYRIDETGALTDIGTVAGLPSQTYFGGTISRDGLLYLIDGLPVDPVENPTRDLYVISGLDTGTPTVVDSFTLEPLPDGSYPRVPDLALNNDDTVIYGWSRNTDQLITIDPATGTVEQRPPTTSLGTIGGLWFNSNGELYGRRNIDGTYYRFDLITGAATAVSLGSPSSFNDAASCPYAVGFTLEVSSGAVDPGDALTYIYTIYNNGSALSGVDFENVLPIPQLTFVDGTLSNTAGGTVNSYGGTNTLAITDLALPANSVTVISVDVRIPAAAPAIVFENQAVLSGLGVFLGSTLESDDPTTFISPDPTAASINIPVELTTFDVTLDGRDALLAWTTASETNNAGFEVQLRRPVAEAFEALAFVEGHGTTTEAQAYAFRAADLAPGTYTFRLKQTDFDGVFAYSPEVETTVELAEAFALSAAYPNPFNLETRFTLAVQQSQTVTVTLYDALGRAVATLFDGRLEAGEARPIRIDGRDLANGAYVYRATGETFAATQRVTLVR